MIGWNTVGNFLSQWYHVKWWREFCVEALKEVLSNEKKMASSKFLRHFFHANFFHVYIINNLSYSFPVHLELICTCEFFKKLKLHSSKQLVQFQLFEKLTSANWFQIELQTVCILAWVCEGLHGLTRVYVGIQVYYKEFKEVYEDLHR